MPDFFKLSISRVQLEILIAFVTVEDNLKSKSFSLRDISRVTGLDFNNTLYREQVWLLENKILKRADEDLFVIDFNNVACVIFVKSNTAILHEFAWRWMIPPKELE